MPSEFCQRILDILRDTSLRDDALKIVEKHCKSLNKTSDELESEDGVFLVIQLMSEANGLLSPKEWAALDARFKALLENGTIRKKGKVKGVILSSVLDYISLKKGYIAVESMKQEMRLPGKFRPETWYPIGVLENLLAMVEETRGERSRCRGMGHHIMSRGQFASAQHLFCNGPMLKDSFSNLREIFMLEKFAVKKDDGEIVVKFDATTTRDFHSFFTGMCDGILKLRNIPANSVEIARKKGIASISLRFKEA